MRTLIITSGAYLEPQLEAEFGRIPPAFLPLGNLRLYQFQLELFKLEKQRIILSLPEDFLVEKHDSQLLEELKVEVIRTPIGISLGDSVVYVINMAACASGSVAILHGDTLITGANLSRADTVSIAPMPAGYEWGTVFRVGNSIKSHWDHQGGAVVAPDEVVLSGWFSFSSGLLLVQSITQSRGDFLQGLLKYNEQLALTPLGDGIWLDFGHADTYYQSRRNFTTQRAFNDLIISTRKATKTGINTNKILAEANWFASAPPPLRIYFPAFLGLDAASDKAVSYSLEYLYLPTLADLFVYGDLSALAWGRIFDALDEVLTSLSHYPAPSDLAFNVDGLYRTKTHQRLHEYAKISGVDISSPCYLDGQKFPSLQEIATLTIERIPGVTSELATIFHGDCCFSNLFYDHRSGLIKMIDPRGIDTDQKFSIFGDRRYDIAKLHHSAIGRYDQIISGHYSLKKNGPLNFSFNLPMDEKYQLIENEFSSRKYAGLSVDDSHALSISVLLFLSMLPLHQDRPDRQDAFIANALRLYKMLLKKLG